MKPIESRPETSTVLAVLRRFAEDVTRTLEGTGGGGTVVVPRPRRTKLGTQESGSHSTDPPPKTSST